METEINKLFLIRNELILKQKENPNEETEKELKFVQSQIEDIMEEDESSH